MINYTSWTIILQYIKAIGLTTSDKLHSESEAEWTNGQTEKLYVPILSHAGNKKPKHKAECNAN